MSATINDLITETYNGGNPVVTTVDVARSIGGTTLSAQSLENWPTNTAVHLQTYQASIINGVTVKTAGTQTDWKAVVGGSFLEELTWQGGVVDSGNSIGDYIEMTPTYSWAQNLAEAIETLHNTDGTWKDGAALNQPTITDFTNANHNHSSSSQGGLLPQAGAQAAYVATNESTSSVSYTDLATTTDTVTVIVGASGNALVSISCEIAPANSDNIGYMGFAVSGNSSISAADSYSIAYQAFTNGGQDNRAGVFLVTGLTAGSNTFKAKYKYAVSGGGSASASFINRRISVVPL